MALPLNHPVSDSIIPGGQLVDVSAASISYAPIPFKGRVVSAFATISAALTGADCIVTVKLLRGGNNSVTIGTITLVQAASYIGQTFEMVISGTEAQCMVNAGDTVVFDSDGASSTTSIANFAAVVRGA